MSYRLKSRESPASGLRRICCEEIKAALAETKSRGRPPGAAVHEFRKHVKKLRAALRLTADEIGKVRYRREDRALRDIAKLASDLRDAHVRLQVIVQLHKKFRGAGFARVFRRIEELLSLELSSFTAACAGWEAKVANRFKAIEKHISSWRLNRLSWKQVCSAVAASYRRGRNQLADTLKKPVPKNFHKWRREVKDLWYQLRLLSPLNRTVLEEIARDAETLGDLLGRDHDFAFLLSRLDLERNDQVLRRERTKLERLIKKRSKRLQRDAAELGRHFYAEPPKAFAKRISIFVKDRR
ncbi:MAG TPA: CHAD domain-containing protein [Chthoniobacterales bacterium]|nr:CHAD domain-containing protein [Chthoniobacterales bacterium]